MLPYRSRPNRYNLSCAIRLYSRESVRQTACLEHAMLAGLHEKRLSKAEMISQGEELWKAEYVISAYRNTFLSTTRSRVSNNLAVSLSATRSTLKENPGMPPEQDSATNLRALLFMLMSPETFQISRMKLLRTMTTLGLQLGTTSTVRCAKAGSFKEETNW